MRVILRFAPSGSIYCDCREAIEAARSKTVADTSGRAERASGSKRARKGVVFLLVCCCTPP